MYLYLFFGLGILVMLYLSSKARREKLKAKWQLLRMLWGLINGAGSGLGTSSMLGMMTPVAVPEISFSICDTNRAAMIQYERLGQKYTYFAPYNRSYVIKMAGFRVELLRSQKEPLDITLQPGLAYRFTAGEIGGTGIRIINEDTGNEQTYGLNEQPEFGVELHE